MISYLPMSSGMKCANCGKGSMYGHKVSHAKNRTKRIFAPNLHTAKVLMKGVMARVRLCTKCLRMLKKSTKKALAPKAQPVAATT